MSETRETDALREAIDNGAATEAEMTSLAGKLERERDEAREQLRLKYGIAQPRLTFFLNAETKPQSKPQCPTNRQKLETNTEG